MYTGWVLCFLGLGIKKRLVIWKLEGEREELGRNGWLSIISKEERNRLAKLTAISEKNRRKLAGFIG